MWLVDLNYIFECDWLIELSDNKLSNNKLSNEKLSDNNLASKLVKNRTFLNQNFLWLIQFEANVGVFLDTDKWASIAS